MIEQLTVGIDVGSGSTKASVFDLAGRLRSVGRAVYAPSQPAPGVAEYDANGLRHAAVLALAEAVRGVDPKAVAVITVDAMMSGAVPIGRDGRPTGPYTTTLDTRFSEHLAKAVTDRESQIKRLTGSGQPTLGPKISWLLETYPDIAARTAKFVLAGGLVGGYLIGMDAEDSYIDPTHLWTTGLADANARTWSEELCRAQDVDVALLPRIVASTDVVGRLTRSIAQATGLPSGLPVVAGCGDQNAGYIGAGVASLGRGGDSAGTYAVFAGVSASFAPGATPDAPDVMPIATGAGFNVQAMVIGGGMTRQWACDLLRGPDPIGGAAPSAEAAELGAASAIGARGVRFIPHLGGQAYPSRPDLRGGWLGLTWAHGPGDMYRAVLEAVALDHAHSADLMRALHPDVRFDSVAVYGGGARSALWTQIKADALGVTYESLGDAPVAELGVAMIGAQGVGLVDDASAAAAQRVPVQRTFHPDSGRHAAYRALLPDYLGATEALSRLDSGN